MAAIRHLSITELEAGMPYIYQAPKDHGLLKMIVRRPADDRREVIERGEVDAATGLVGDNWVTRGSKHTPDGLANLNAQITVMSSRAIELVAQAEERWSLAGDQLYIDLDISHDNLPPGTRLAIGQVVLEVSAAPHTGCRKFSDRFGVDAMKFVNSDEGKRLRLRGVNTRVIRGGVIQVGDVVRKIAAV